MFLNARWRALFSVALLLSGLTPPTMAQEVVNIYGPGGPLPPMKEAAATFGKARNTTINVTAGPTPQWLDKAKQDADVIFSGAENMMTDFIRLLEGRILEDTVDPLYLRPSVVLVRPGNPKGIAGIRDLLKPDMKVLVVQGAGQTGLWEDIVGRTGDIGMVRAFRKNIVGYAANSAEAQKVWDSTPGIDAWIIWNIWGANERTRTDIVEIEPDLRIYRDTGVALTKTGSQKASARDFVAFLKSEEGTRIFEKHGWMEKAP